MNQQNLINYINTELQRGVSEQEVRQKLIETGWQATEVDAVLQARTFSNPESAPPRPPQMSQDEAYQTVERMGRFKASWTLFKQSWNLLKKDKEVMWFLVLSGVITLFVVVLLIVTMTIANTFLGEEATEASQNVLLYAILFIYFIIVSFIVTFFKVGLTAVVFERINGNDIGFREGISRAGGITGKIFVWSLITSTVGIVLSIISDRSKWLGKLVANLLGTAWNIVTLFIAPTLLLDNVSVWQSIKNSGTVFKKTWGETLIMSVSMGLIATVFVFGLTSLFALLIGIAISMGLGAIVNVILLVLFVVILVAFIIIYTSLGEIFKVALYSYARFGIIAEGFSPELLIGASKTKK